MNLSNKFAKLLLLLEVLNSKFVEFAPLEQEYSVDEAMMPYFGRHPVKQFIKGKPIRWGYKLRAGTLRSGYIVWFMPYQGRSRSLPNLYKDVGLGASVVDVSQASRPNARFHLFFDNSFSSLTLINERSQRGTGTIRDNRTVSPLPPLQ